MSIKSKKSSFVTKLFFLTFFCEKDTNEKFGIMDYLLWSIPIYVLWIFLCGKETKKLQFWTKNMGLPLWKISIFRPLKTRYFWSLKVLFSLYRMFPNPFSCVDVFGQKNYKHSFYDQNYGKIPTFRPLENRYLHRLFKGLVFLYRSLWTTFLGFQKTPKIPKPWIPDYTSRKTLSWFQNLDFLTWGEIRLTVPLKIILTNGWSKHYFTERHKQN